MSKKKRKIGDRVIHNGIEKTIVEIKKGEPTKKPNMQSGVMFTGFQNQASKYVLSDGKVVTGGMIKFLQ